jgi:tRNA modification GTPase
MLARDATAGADLCLWLLDASAPPTWPEDNLHDQENLKLVVNKTDLSPVWEIDQPVLRVSALTGAGLVELVEAMARWLVPHPPPPGAAVPFTPDLASLTEEALNHARTGRVEKMKEIVAALANDAR